MGALFLSTSTGPYAFWPSACLWAVPPLVAMRCLPLHLAFPVVIVSGAVGRMFIAPTPAPDWSDIAVAVAVPLPLYVVDRVLMRRFPVHGQWAWPLAVTTAAWVAMKLLGAAPDTVLTLFPVPDVDATELASAGARTDLAAIFVTAWVAQGFAGMATVLNFHDPDPHPAEVRERGVRRAALVSFALLLAFAICGLLY